MPQFCWSSKSNFFCQLPRHKWLERLDIFPVNLAIQSSRILCVCFPFVWSKGSCSEGISGVISIAYQDFTPVTVDGMRMESCFGSRGGRVFDKSIQSIVREPHESFYEKHYSVYCLYSETSSAFTRFSRPITIGKTQCCYSRIPSPHIKHSTIDIDAAQIWFSRKKINHVFYTK